MAEAVEEALAQKKSLVVEAGTGIGKTLAYLVPAILSGERVIISTGTKNLQDQLFFRDLPAGQEGPGRVHQDRPAERAGQLSLPAPDDDGACGRAPAQQGSRGGTRSRYRLERENR